MILFVERVLECSLFFCRLMCFFFWFKFLLGFVGIFFEVLYFVFLIFFCGRKFLIKEKIMIIMNVIGIKMESRRDNKLFLVIFVISKFLKKYLDLFLEFG